MTMPLQSRGFLLLLPGHSSYGGFQMALSQDPHSFLELKMQFPFLLEQSVYLHYTTPSNNVHGSQRSPIL